MTHPRIEQNGRLAVARDLSPAVLAAVRRDLTFETPSYTPQGRESTTVRLYEQLDDGLYFGAGARFRVANLAAKLGEVVSNPGDARHSGPQYVINYEALADPGLKCRPGQMESMLSLMMSDCGTVWAPTGFGKNFCIGILCRLFPKANIHYLTYSGDVWQETLDSLRTLMTGVGFCKGAKRKPGRVMAVSIDSAHHTGYDADIVLVDEVHQLGGPKFTSQLAGYGVNRPCRMYGFSASPERDDNKHRMVEPFCGPVVYRMPYQEAVDAKMVVPITVKWVRPDVAFDPASGLMMGATKERASVWQNAARNRAIVDEARLVPVEDQVLILVHTVEHALHLKRLLPEFDLCYAASKSSADQLERMQKSGLIDASIDPMTPAKRTETRKRFAVNKLRRVIANGVWSTGVNFHHLKWLIRADGLKSSTKAIQIAGRLSRPTAGKTAATLIDFWDDWSNSLISRARARKRVYAAQQFTQIDPPPRPRGRRSFSLSEG